MQQPVKLALWVLVSRASRWFPLTNIGCPAGKIEATTLALWFEPRSHVTRWNMVVEYIWLGGCSREWVFW